MLKKALLFLFLLVEKISVFLLLFIGANVKNKTNVKQSFLLKITKIYNLQKHLELIRFQQLD
jgi:hypothetical protein